MGRSNKVRDGQRERKIKTCIVNQQYESNVSDAAGGMLLLLIFSEVFDETDQMVHLFIREIPDPATGPVTTEELQN